MNKNKGVLLVIMVLLVSLAIGCTGKEGEKTKEKSNVSEDTTNALSTEDYLTYIDNKYKEYLNDLEVDTKYAIDKVDVTAEGYMEDLKGAYKDLEDRLVSFKNDLVNGVKTSDEKVKALNDDLINSVDAAIREVRNFSSDLSSKGKDLAGKTEDDVKTALTDMESTTKSARTKIATLISDAKAHLGID